MPERFLVTGGAGFIGSNLARRHREQGYEVQVDLQDGLQRSIAWFVNGAG